MKRNDLLNRMARLAKRYGFEFSKTPDIHGGGHDKWYVRGDAVIVPRHSEINELTAKGILKEWDALLAEAQRDMSRDEEEAGK
ncbi:hypothetical protein [Streptosporangium sp. NPDC006007]|uniref:hypothetical protein n=1 Tax=Streptosporangium sp. NPDC006007 TaxID=3154575 RepID=UPI00339DDB88